MVTKEDIRKYVDDRLAALNVNCIHQSKGIRELNLIKDHFLKNEQPSVPDEAVKEEEKDAPKKPKKAEE